MPVSLEGQTLGKYRVMQPLGRGGMAQVYQAYHPQLDRYVAIKVLRSDLVDEHDFLARFQREAQAVANMRHANVVHVYDFDVQDEVYYMVMELLDGDTLKARMSEYRTRSERMSYPEILRIMLDVLAGLEYAHSEGVIHRDIKPGNIMLTRRGQAVLTDFGIAQIVGSTQYTVSGALMGTLAYMAPEQGLEGKTSARSDLYSLGIVFYEMLTGRIPFEADTPLAVLMKHVNDPLPLPRNLDASIPASLERVVLKALAKRPEERFAHAAEMAQALQLAAEYLEVELPEELPEPDFTEIKLPKGAAVLSGSDREHLVGASFVSDETDIHVAQATAQKPATAETSSQNEVVEQPGSEAFLATNLAQLRAPKGAFKGSTRAVLLSGLALVGLNLTAVFLGLISGNWRFFSVGWPAEILLLSLALCLLLSTTGVPWLVIPTGILLGNGLLLSFYSLTGLWSWWRFLWPLEPLLVLASLGTALWLAGRGEDRFVLTRQLASRLTQLCILALLIVVALTALPLG